MKTTTNGGAAMVAKLEAWIGSYMAMPADYAFVCALWAVHTWVYDRFEMTPYLSITGEGPGVGKSTLMKVLEYLCRGSLKTTAATPAGLLRAIGESNGHITLFIDEAESMGREGQTLLGQLANSGYTFGDVILRAAPGAVGTVKYRSFCPKVWAGIGDLRDTLRSRSVVLRLTAGTPARTFYRSMASGEAVGLVDEMKASLNAIPSLAIVEPAHLKERQREIWTPLFSVASMLGCDLERLTAISSDFYSEAKTVEKRRAVAVVEDDGTRIEREFAPRAVADWLRVVEPGEDFMWSGVAVARMKTLADGPWRKFRGEGLTEMGLAALFARYDGLQNPAQIKRWAKGDRVLSRKADGATQINRRGFYVDAVKKAARSVGRG